MGGGTDATGAIFVEAILRNSSPSVFLDIRLFYSEIGLASSATETSSEPVSGRRRIGSEVFGTAEDTWRNSQG
jgi:hypothetical protein